MNTKYWKLDLRKNGRRVTLFVTTTDRMIEQDFEGSWETSLIRTTRQYHRHGQTAEQDHRDLAIGALMRYAASAIYDLSYEHVEKAQQVPVGLPNRYVGGGFREEYVPVWERAQHDTPDPDAAVVS